MLMPNPSKNGLGLLAVSLGAGVAGGIGFFIVDLVEA